MVHPSAEYKRLNDEIMQMVSRGARSCPCLLRSRLLVEEDAAVTTPIIKFTRNLPESRGFLTSISCGSQVPMSTMTNGSVNSVLGFHGVMQGRSKGNKWTLYSRSFIQKLLFGLGNFVHARSYYVIMTVLLLFSVCCLGLQKVHIETDIVKLWVAQGGRLDGELNFLKNAKNMSFAGSNSSNTAEIIRENGLDGGFQVVIQTPEYTGENILTLKDCCSMSIS